MFISACQVLVEESKDSEHNIQGKKHDVNDSAHSADNDKQWYGEDSENHSSCSGGRKIVSCHAGYLADKRIILDQSPANRSLWYIAK